MKTTQDKIDALSDAIDDFEVARDAIADAISDICEDLAGLDVAERLETAEPDANVIDNLRVLFDEITDGYVSDEDEDS